MALNFVMYCLDLICNFVQCRQRLGGVLKLEREWSEWVNYLYQLTNYSQHPK
jgi:hypothetical protein